MPKYLTFFKYSAEGHKGLLKDKASGRLASVTKAVESLGGRLHSFDWVTSGEYTGCAIWDFPDSATLTSFLSVVESSGMFAATKSFELLGAAEMDRALGKTVTYRPPGA
jgi:uncharacterized protein with GYD domain